MTCCSLCIGFFKDGNSITLYIKLPTSTFHSCCLLFPRNMRVTKVKCSVDALFPICPTGLRQPLKATWSVVTPRKVNFLFFYRKKSFPFFNKLSLRTKSYPQRERKQEKGKKIINKVYLLIRLPVVDGQVYSSSPLLFAFIKFFFFLHSGHLGALLCRLCLFEGQRLTWTSLKKKIDCGFVIYDICFSGKC